MNQSVIQYAAGGFMARAVATGLFVSLCTVQAPDGNLSATGGPSGTYANVANLINIPCMNAPIADGAVQATEVKALDEIMSKSIRHVLLNSYYAQLDGLNWGNIGWRAVVDGTVFDLMGSERDSQSTMTRLKIQLVSV